MNSFQNNLLSLLFVVSGATALAQAKLNQDCAAFPEPLPGKYCVFTTEGSKNEDVLYYLHGAGLDEKTWGTETYYPALIRQDWDDSGKDAPTVVSISFGPAWLLVPKNSVSKSGLLELVADKLIPAVEAKLGGVKGRRLLVGDSMGGFNTAALVLHHPKLFVKAGLLCPGISTLSPFASDEEIQEFLKRTKANVTKMMKSQMIALMFVPDAATWKTVAPLELAPTKLDENSPSLYVSCGTADSYGFYEGVQQFARIAKERKADAVWHPIYSGDHCAVDARSVARFLIQ